MVAHKAGTGTNTVVHPVSSPVLILINTAEHVKKIVFHLPSLLHLCTGQMGVLMVPSL